MDFFNPKKKLGQHFLKDLKIADKIVNSLKRDKKDLIIEIGPGKGILTEKLIKIYSNLYLIEIDKDLLPHLKLKFPKLEKKILNMDFLKFTFDDFFFKKNNISIIGNFPYNISSQIIFKIIDNKDHIDCLVGMFQKEVAKRICEKPGSKTYGIISVLTQLYFDVKYLFTVSPEVFTPKPKVFSGVIYLKKKEKILINCNKKLLHKIVKTSFQQRRKTLRNSLKSFKIPESIAEDSIFDLRPEKISSEGFIALTELIENGKAT
tara:strand:+ start:67 stop:852 length:786 start_codon:yes stop_codon:yes gene_type:complete